MPEHLAALKGERRDGCVPRLTAVLLVAAIGTVLKSIAAEAADDTVDATGTGEEGRTTFRFCFGYRWKRNTESRQGMKFSGHSLLTLLTLNV